MGVAEVTPTIQGGTYVLNYDAPPSKPAPTPPTTTPPAPPPRVQADALTRTRWVIFISFRFGECHAEALALKAALEELGIPAWRLDLTRHTCAFAAVPKGTTHMSSSHVDRVSF